ncbi:MAG: hypothetical protein CME75_01505 [Halomonas sp.]|nr:hypothetical protein [Halomonas sp.]
MAAYNTAPSTYSEDDANFVPDFDQYIGALPTNAYDSWYFSAQGTYTFIGYLDSGNNDAIDQLPLTFAPGYYVDAYGVSLSNIGINSGTRFSLYPTSYQQDDFYIDEDLQSKTLTSINAPSEPMNLSIGNGTVVLEYALTLQVGYRSPNQPPSDINLSDATINQSEGSSEVAVGALLASDPDAGDSHSFLLVDGAGDTHNNLFSISGSSLVAKTPSAMAAGNYSVRVRAQDQDGLAVDKIFTVTVVDDVAPGIVSINSADGGAGSISYTITFDEPVNGISADDFSLTSSGTAVGSVAAVSGSGAVYVATVNDVGGEGTLRLDVKPSTNITDAAGNLVGAYSQGSAYIVDTIPPVVTASNITLSGASGIGGVFRQGDIVTVVWDNTTAGDNNGDVAAVNVDFSAFGGQKVAASQAADKWSATYTIQAGAIDATHRNVTVSASDNAGNVTNTTSTDVSVDNQAPALSSTAISLEGASGTGGVYKIGDTVTAKWNNTAVGDNNSDTLSTVTVDFSDLGGGTAVAASNADGMWQASYTVLAGAIDADNRHVTVKAVDDAGNVSTATSAVTVGIDNMAPGTLTGILTVDEGSSNGTLVGVIASAGSDVVAYSLADDADGRFVIDSSGNVRVADGSLLNYAITTSHTINVVATDNAGNTTESPFTVQLNNVNELPTGNVTIDGVAEQGVTLSATYAINDADGLSGPVHYQWLRDGEEIGGATSATYTLGQSDVGAVMTVAVRYIDDQGTAEEVVSLPSAVVANINDAPVLTPLNPMLTGIDEDALNNAGQTVASLLSNSLVDIDQGALEGIAVNGVNAGKGGWQYSIDSGASWQAMGEVDESTALLLGSLDWVRFVPNGESGETASFSYRGWDQTAGAAGQRVDSAVNGGTTPFSTAQDLASIAVMEVNDVPMFITPSTTLPVPENTFAVTTLAATDADGDPLSYMLAGGADQALFSLNIHSGALTFINVQNYEAFNDADHDGVYEVVVVADDGQGGVTPLSLEVTVTDINEAPTLDGTASVSTTENSSSIVYTANGNDPESDTLTYTLGGTDAALFTLDANSGALSFNSAPDFEAPKDDNADNTYDVILTANDGSLSSVSQALSISVDDINEAPTLETNTGATIMAGRAVTITSAMLSARDEDDDATDLTYTLTVLPGSGELRLGEVPLSLTDTFTQADLDAGRVSYQAGGVVGEQKVSFKVADGGEDGAATISDAFTIDVQPRPSTPVPEPIQVVPTPGVSLPATPSGQPSVSETITNTGRDQGTVKLVENSGNANEVIATLPGGVSLVNQGARTAVDPLMALDDLINSIDAQQPSNLTEQAGVAGQWLANRLEGTLLDIRTLVISDSSGSSISTPVQISGIGNGNSSYQEAFVIDVRSLPQGNRLQLDNIDFASIIGETMITGGTGANVIVADDAAQMIVLGEDDDELHAGGGRDLVGSKGGNDLIFGETGYDRLFGGEGDDVLNGGSGVDVARFTLDAASAELRYADDGSLMVSAGALGTDTLSSIELLRFDDQVVLVDAPAPQSVVGFDEESYLGSYTDVAAAVTQGIFATGYSHYLQYGKEEGRAGERNGFDETFYLAQNSDVAAAVERGEFMSGFHHYISWGMAERRDPNALFDEEWYLAQNIDVDQAVELGAFDNGYDHYLMFGSTEQRLPSAWFDTADYLANNEDVVGAQFNPVLHYLAYGVNEGRVIVAADDGLWG